MYGTVQDDLTKQRIEYQLGELRSKAFVEALKTANAEFEQSRVASYPTSSPSMFMLVGDKLIAEWPRAGGGRVSWHPFRPTRSTRTGSETEATP